MTALLGVYRDRETAEAVADEVAHVHPDARLRVGDPRDHDEALRAEMEAEVAESWASPGLGAFLTAEQMRGAFVFAITLGAAGLVVGLILGWALYDAPSSTWTKLGVGALI